MTARRLMPFQTAKLKIERARHHARVFRARADAGDTGGLGAVLRSFVRELRGALDATVADIARVKGRDPDDLRFPFAENAQQLADLCDVEFRGIDEELADYLRKLRPYPGGHPYLHRLRGLDGDAACRDFAAANGAAASALIDEVFRAAAETCGEMSARFWQRM